MLAIMKKSIYIKRNLILSDAFLLWCQKAGFEFRLPKNDIHVTVAYSRAKVEKSAIKLKKDVIMDITDDRELHMFGDAVVFIFRNVELYKRWEELKLLGCSWDHDDYSPHITLTYKKPTNLNINKIEVFKGPLILGEEILEDLNLEKSDEYKEIKIKNNVLEW